MIEPTQIGKPGCFDHLFMTFGALTWPNGYDRPSSILCADMNAMSEFKIESAAA